MSLVRKSAGMELIDLLDRVLDKGIVVEASSRLHMLGADGGHRKTHLAIAAFETYMTHSEARAVAKVTARLAVASHKSEAEPRPLLISRSARPLRRYFR